MGTQIGKKLYEYIQLRGEESLTESEKVALMQIMVEHLGYESTPDKTLSEERYQPTKDIILKKPISAKGKKAVAVEFKKKGDQLHANVNEKGGGLLGHYTYAKGKEPKRITQAEAAKIAKMVMV